MINHYRPITVQNIIVKLYTKILSNSIKQYMPLVTGECQYAGVKGRTIQDAIRKVNDMIKQIHYEKINSYFRSEDQVCL